MLEVGNEGITVEEKKIDFGLWSISKAPLLIGCEITNISKETFEILTNTEFIAINQDKLVVQGRKITTECQYQEENLLTLYNYSSQSIID